MKRTGDSPDDSRRDGINSNAAPSPKPSAEGFDIIDKTIGEGSIAVFADIKAPPFAAESELIDLKIVLPSKWSKELLERIEECIDDFGKEKGIGKTRIIEEGTGC